MTATQLARPRLAPSRTGLAAALIAAAVAALYVWLIREGHVGASGDDRAAVRFTAASFALTAAAIFAGATIARADLRVVLLAAGGAVALAWGVVGLLSIGLPLLLAGLLALVALRRSWARASWQAATLALMVVPVGVGVVIGGLALTR